MEKSIAAIALALAINPSHHKVAGDDETKIQEEVTVSTVADLAKQRRRSRSNLRMMKSLTLLQTNTSTLLQTQYESTKARELVEIYNKYKANKHNLPVFQAACVAGDYEAVELLIKHGTDPNQSLKGYYNQLPAIQYLLNKTQINFDLPIEKRVLLIELLLKNGAKVTGDYNIMFSEAIKYCMQFGDKGVQIIKMILESGNPVDRGLTTALCLQISNREEQIYQEKIIDLLLEHGATF